VYSERHLIAEDEAGVALEGVCGHILGALADLDAHYAEFLCQSQ
jgi:hypothetical protein